MIQAGDVHLQWSEAGQLLSMEQAGRRTAFSYGHDTRLDRALLASGQDVRYFYGQELLPVKVTRNGSVAAEYQWRDTLRLRRHKDALCGLVHEFVYGDRRSPVQCIVSGTKEAVYNATGHYERSLTLNVWTDQVDSVRVLSLPDGRPVKCIEYDAFGNVAADTRPEWKFPLGFACGLNDHFTGLVRFGFRDYDPRFGRFTAKDPIGDTGGDHDLWDYCVDDPVNLYDPSGMEGESPEGEPGLFRQRFGWWTLPHDHPVYQERASSFSRSMRKELYETAGGILDYANAHSRIPQGRLAPYLTPGPANPGPSAEDRAKSTERFIKRRDRHLGSK